MVPSNAGRDCFVTTCTLPVPSGYPRSVSHVASDARTLRLFWSPPPQEEQNGVIVHYGITIMEAETSEVRQYTTRDAATTFVVPNLHPHYNYNFTVSASTSAGYGPHSPSTYAQMPQDGKHDYCKTR